MQHPPEGPGGAERERLLQTPKVRQELALFNLLLYCAYKLAEQYETREESAIFAELIADAEDSGMTPSHPKVPKPPKKK